MKTISVCYILSYYSPQYVRTETLVKALQKIENLELYQARNSSKGFWRYFETLWKLFWIRLFHNPQYYILGFRGYEFFWIVRLITIGKVLIYDHMMSPYDSLVNEKKTIRKESLIGKVIYFYEKVTLLASDLALTDTNIHKRYFHELFDIPLKKIEAVPVGADEDLFHPDANTYQVTDTGFLEVLYYGSFLPLHGIAVILKAASLLRDKPIHFTLIGGNRLDLSEFHNFIMQHRLNNVKHIDWVEYEELPRYIARVDLGLGGPFGNTGQAGRVITGKTFQFLAMAKPVVIGLYNGEDNGFEDKVNSLVVPRGDAQALSQAISWALEHKESLNQIGQRGYELYLSRYSIGKISEMLKGIIPL